MQKMQDQLHEEGQLRQERIDRFISTLNSDEVRLPKQTLQRLAQGFIGGTMPDYIQKLIEEKGEGELPMDVILKSDEAYRRLISQKHETT